MWRLIYSIPVWFLFTLLRGLLIGLGWILIPIAAYFKAYEMTDPNVDKPDDGPIYHFTWKFMWLWDNKTDGIANRNYKKLDSMFKQIVYWSAERNPVNNLRYVPYLSFKMDTKKVNWDGSFGSKEELELLNECFGILETKEVYANVVRKYDDDSQLFWLFAWHGFYTVVRIQYKVGKSIRRLWIGWKIHPDDSLVDNPRGYRSESVGATSRLFQKVWPK